jgi:hypothetical protein
MNSASKRVKSARTYEPHLAAGKLVQAMSRLELNGKIPATYRSRIGANRVLLTDYVDGRTHRARRFKENFQGISSDLGGAAYLSTLKRALVMRASALVVIAEELEQRYMAHQRPRQKRRSLAELEGDIRFMQAHALTVRTLTNVSRLLGLDRVAKTVPSADPAESVPRTLENYLVRTYPPNKSA